MLFQTLIESNFNVGKEYSVPAYLLLCAFVIIRVGIDCRKLSEGIGLHLLPIMFFPLLYLTMWLFVWPGTLRLAMKGRKLDDTVRARMARRSARPRRH